MTTDILQNWISNGKYTAYLSNCGKCGDIENVVGHHWVCSMISLNILWDLSVLQPLVDAPIMFRSNFLLTFTNLLKTVFINVDNKIKFSNSEDKHTYIKKFH